MKQIKGLVEGKDAGQIAKRKAQYGHRDWVRWQSGGVSYAAPKTPESVKAALLASGVKGKFLLYSASSGNGLIINWAIGINVWNNSKRGF